MRRRVQLVALGLAAILAVWYRAVGGAGEVRARKAAWREARAARR